MNAIWAWLPAVLSGRSPADYWGFNCSPSDEDPCKSWIDKSKTVSGSKEDWEKIPYGNIKYDTDRKRWLDPISIHCKACSCPHSTVHLVPGYGSYGNVIARFGIAGYGRPWGVSIFNSTTLASFSMIGLAFIIGYNVEIMFWLFDRLFDSLRVKDRAGERERTKPASPKALQLEAG